MLYMNLYTVNLDLLYKIGTYYIKGIHMHITTTLYHNPLFIKRGIFTHN